MPEQSKNSAPDAGVPDERAWMRQLRRDRRAALSAMDEDTGMPGPGAAGVEAAGRQKNPLGSGLMRYGVQKSWAASGLQSVPQAETSSQDDGSDAMDAGGDEGGAAQGGSQMRSADEEGGGRQGTSAYESMSARRLQKERMKNMQEQAKIQKKSGGTSVELSKEKESIEKELEKASIKFTRFTLPSITMWRIVAGEFLTPIVDFTAIHGYAIASMLGIKAYAPKKLNVGEWLLLLVLDGIVLTAIFLMVVLAATAIAFAQCLSEFYSCGLPLLPSAVSSLVP